MMDEVARIVAESKRGAGADIVSNRSNETDDMRHGIARWR